MPKSELESLIAGSDNSPAAIRAILSKLAASRIYAVVDKPWDGRSAPQAGMRLLLVTDGADHGQPMLALFSAAQHAQSSIGGEHAFKNVVEVDAGWALLGVEDNTGILINPNATDVPTFRIGPAVAAELKKYAEDRLRAARLRMHSAAVAAANPAAPDAADSEARTLRDGDDLPAARAKVEGILAINPADYNALHLAGEIAIEQYRNREAKDYFSAAVAAAPDRAARAASLSGLGQALTWSGQFEAAEETLRQAIQTDPGVPGPLRALAEAKAEKGEVNEAIDLLRRLAVLQPRDASLYIRIGELLMDSGRGEEALDLYDMALGIDAGNPMAHFNKGVALQAQGHTEDAMACYRKAQELGPQLIGFYRIVSLRKFTSSDDPDVAKLKQREADVDPRNVFKSIDAHFSLAKVYDDLGDYPKAFEHLKKGNDLKRSRISFSIDEQRETFAKLIALFTPAFMERFRERPRSAAQPIFILGMPRSGTTLLEQMLAGHKEIYGAGELSVMQITALQVGAAWGKRGDNFPGSDAQLRADFEQAALRYDRLTQHLPRGTRRLTDKMPQNFLFIGLIDLMFEDCTIINCRRNPVASGLSGYQHVFNKENMPFSYDLGEIAEYYKLYAGLMQHWHKLLPGKILDVDYEAMVSDPEAQLRRVLDHAHLEFDPACLDFHSLDRPVYTASATQVRKPLYDTSVEKWKNYEPYLQPLIAGLGDLAKGWPKAK
jgi:tetratricopeptide (TPR) repeat protein